MNRHIYIYMYICVYGAIEYWGEGVLVSAVDPFRPGLPDGRKVSQKTGTTCRDSVFRVSPGAENTAFLVLIYCIN